ncbi:lactoylglutathione lyase [Chitinophaga skermanii]|uniref:Lactoylglutathione lyase n=1 Tax=Chitinophaga skermanii TaxID=331697 RepID=A0A327QM19_9BACT|nr:VOC family protein [Chitinophaga skermanii]RAJ05380.1 lactoylglutathione lyase [Chitinophaga skermanii]
MKKVFITGLLLWGVMGAKAQEKKPPIMLNHIAMYVHDLKKATDFYINILQFPVADEPFKDGKHTWFDLSPTSRLHLIEGAPTEIKRDKNDHLCFSVASIEDFIKRLEKFKVDYSDWGGKPKAITHRVDGVKQIYFQDPDGHWIEINNDGYK